MSYPWNDRRILKGSIRSGETVRIDLDDGNYLNGWRIVYFTAWRSQMMRSPGSGNCNLYSSDPGGITDQDDPGVSNWLGSAWYSVASPGGGVLDGPFMESRYATDQVIQEDLFVLGTDTGDEGTYCYLIEIERVRMTPNQGLFQRSQAAEMGTLE